MRKPLVTVILSVFLSTALPGMTYPASTTASMSFDPEKIQISKLRDYDHITMRGCDLTDRVGYPQLPVFIQHFPLPAGAIVTDVKVLGTVDEILPGEYLPFPAQPPAILSIPGIDVPVPSFVEPLSEIYESNKPFPARVVEAPSSGNLGTRSIGSVLVHPLTYRPGDGSLVFHSRVDFEIEYETGAPRQLERREGSHTGPLLTDEMLTSLSEVSRAFGATGPDGGTMRPLGREEFPYVIVTSQALQPAFVPLREWKSKKGIRAMIVTTEYINVNYTGNDLAEKIRNFLIDAFETAGLQWVLLGGDTNVVPERIAWAMDCEFGMSPDENDIPADLYYSDLDGTWDANSNGTFGEVDDEVDLYPDVIVARASVENTSEAEAFVSKVLAYERTPTPDYQTNFLMAAEILWPDPYTDASIGAEMIDSLFIPPQFDPITKLYQSLGNESPAAVAAALNEGQNFFNHDGHCNYNIMSMGTGYFFNSDMDALVNGERCGILYSIGCWPAAIDYDCIAEHFVTNPDGGGIGFLGNSRYGWGSPGNPGFGYSERYVHRFYHSMFLDGYLRPAVALSLAKSYYVSRSRVENVYRIHQYEVNFLGDPELSMWTNIPVPVMVSCPDSITGGSQPVPISVRNTEGPVTGALVCIMGDELYMTGITDEAGRVILDPVPVMEESLMITVTGENILPYEGVIRVKADGPRATVVTAVITDTNGNNDGFLNPGEEATLTVEVRNTGTDPLAEVRAVMALGDDYCTLLDSTEWFGAIDVGDTAYGTGGVGIQVGSECPSGHLVFIRVALSDSAGNVWSGSLSFIVRLPTLGCYRYELDDVQSGDCDSLLDPGEYAVLKIYLGNSGLGNAHDVTAHVTTLNPNIVLPETSFSLGTMVPGSEDTLEVGLSADVLTQAPSFPAIVLRLFDTEGNSMIDTLHISVGTESMKNDFENGENRWTHNGTNDEWHLSTLNAHSGEYAWYCGDEGSNQYTNRMRANLIPPAVYIAPHARFSFWCWYEVTTYGVDGIYVQADDGQGWQDLDFIGSGGALDSLLNIGNIWHQESYDLSRYPVGTRVALRIRFASDQSEVAEGFYIDDVWSNCPIDTTVSGIGAGDEMGPLPKVFSLSQNYPNPFNPATTITFDVPEGTGGMQSVSLVIYDIRGRHVKTLIDSFLEPGIYRVIWDGRNRRGETVSSGAYFYTLRNENESYTRKMTVLK